MVFSVESIQFLRPLEDQTLEELGQTATFECEISKEGLKGEWFKGDKAIKAGEKYEMVDQATVHKLIISDGAEDDQSKYTVKFKEAKTTAKLIIKGI